MVDNLLLWHILWFSAAYPPHRQPLGQIAPAPERLDSDDCNACNVIQNCSPHTIGNKFTGYASIYIRADNHTVSAIFTLVFVLLESRKNNYRVKNGSIRWSFPVYIDQDESLTCVSPPQVFSQQTEKTRTSQHLSLNAYTMPTPPLKDTL